MQTRDPPCRIANPEIEYAFLPYTSDRTANSRAALIIALALALYMIRKGRSFARDLKPAYAELGVMLGMDQKKSPPRAQIYQKY